MKKYKLIKEYPGSPKLETIVQKNTTDYKYEYVSYEITKVIRYITINIVEQYPEYWEKVVEKDYEVLSLSYNDGIYSYVDFKDPNKYWFDKSRKGTSRGHLNLSEVEMYETAIHSVKRLSDGEVFTVGDKCDIDGQTFTIDRFSLADNTIYFIESLNNPVCDITDDQLKKVKFLFTTEDDVDIFEGNYYWIVMPSYKAPSREIRSTLYLSYPEAKYFSTKEAAEEYILMNKPCLSINDIKTACHMSWYALEIDKLKKLIKSRL